jgi:protease I
MANEKLIGVKVAVLVEDGFEQIELLEPREALEQAGAQTSIVSPKKDRVRGWNFTEWGDELSVDVALDRARPQDFDALLLPGGVINPDALRIQPKAIDFIKAFFDAGKPVASICHGPWTIIEAGAARGSADRLVAIAQDRSQERRRRVDGSGGRGGWKSRHEPQA